jgi:hypothetical protein
MKGFHLRDSSSISIDSNALMIGATGSFWGSPSLLKRRDSFRVGGDPSAFVKMKKTVPSNSLNLPGNDRDDNDDETKDTTNNIIPDDEDGFGSGGEEESSVEDSSSDDQQLDKFRRNILKELGLGESAEERRLTRSLMDSSYSVSTSPKVCPHNITSIHLSQLCPCTIIRHTYRSHFTQIYKLVKINVVQECFSVLVLASIYLCVHAVSMYQQPIKSVFTHSHSQFLRKKLIPGHVTLYLYCNANATI